MNQNFQNYRISRIDQRTKKTSTSSPSFLRGEFFFVNLILERKAEYDKKKTKHYKLNLRLRQQIQLPTKIEAIPIAVPIHYHEEQTYHGGVLSTNCLSGQRVFVDLTFLVLFVSRQKEHYRKRRKKNAIYKRWKACKEKQSEQDFQD